MAQKDDVAASLRVTLLLLGHREQKPQLSYSPAIAFASYSSYFFVTATLGGCGA